MVTTPCRRGNLVDGEGLSLAAAETAEDWQPWYAPALLTRPTIRGAAALVAMHWGSRSSAFALAAGQV